MKAAGHVLSGNLLARLKRGYRERFGLDAAFVTLGGVLVAEDDRYGVNNLPALIEIRRKGLIEAVRWGEPFVFFPAAGVISWIVPLVRGDTVEGGISGGCVLADDEPSGLSVAADWLADAGARPGPALDFLRSLPVWPRDRPHEAAAFLYRDLYDMTGFKPDLLDRNRENATQQRQIAEEIHSGKSPGGRRANLWDEEKRLLFMLRTGDRNGARKILNTMLAAIFLRSPKPALIQARVVELVGYLVRAAVEDDPLMDPLVERHVGWIEDIVSAREFDVLCECTRRILDEYMETVSPQSRGTTSAHLQKVMGHIEANFATGVELADLSRLTGLSRFHLSRLIRKATGRSLPGHVLRLRIREACRLLETTDTPYSQIALDLGFADQSYFIKRFREVTGITPLRYRQERRT